MADDALLRKLLVRPDRRLLVLGAPAELLPRLDPLPDGGAPAIDAGDGPFEVVLVFATSQADVRERAPAALGALAQDGVLWLAYPKRSSKVASDLTRDAGWEALWEAGWQVVSAVSLDDTWSGLRFRPVVS